MKLPITNSRGFTLIEILVSLTIITILSVTVYVALNPAQRLKDAKDARRAQDVDSILNAIHEFVVDNKGVSPTNMPAAGTHKQLGTAGSGCNISNANCTIAATDCVDLMSGTNNLSNYIKAIPHDPTLADGTKTGYSVQSTTAGIVTITACYTDATPAISASR